MDIVRIKTSDIFNDPTFNCRGAIAPLDVFDLAKDIEKHGLQQPIVIQPYKNRYRIVCGHRRHKAFAILNKEYIPCIINKDLTESEALILNLGENLHRKDLNILQESKALERLKDVGLSIAEVAEQLNKSSTWVRIRYLLLELPEIIQQAAAAGFINQKQITDLHKIEGITEQVEEAKKIKEARARGDKPPRIKKYKYKRNILKIRVRDPDDIFWMQDHIQGAVGNNFGTRCLAWAAGQISDFELFEDIRDIAGSKYRIPYEGIV
jgi:ParB/RepB/Spo0J family partition protein